MLRTRLAYVGVRTEVVLGEFDWNLFVWIEVLQDMPVALTWVGWQNEVQLVRRLPDCGSVWRMLGEQGRGSGERGSQKREADAF